MSALVPQGMDAVRAILVAIVVVGEVVGAAVLVCARCLEKRLAGIADPVVQVNVKLLVYEKGNSLRPGQGEHPAQCGANRRGHIVPF